MTCLCNVNSVSLSVLKKKSKIFENILWGVSETLYYLIASSGTGTAAPTSCEIIIMQKVQTGRGDSLSLGLMRLISGSGESFADLTIKVRRQHINWSSYSEKINPEI